MSKHQVKYKVGDMYAPAAVFNAVVQMSEKTDPIVRVYESLRKNSTDFNMPRKITAVMDNHVHLEGIPVPITFIDLRGLFMPVYIASEPSDTGKTRMIIREDSSIVLDKFFTTAQQVKTRTISDVVHHLSAEVGEISECLVQPKRGGDIVEESVDAIVCALDVIYLKLKNSHGKVEMAQTINKLLDKKLQKWYDTCS